MQFRENLFKRNLTKKKDLVKNQVLWTMRGSNPRHSGCKPDARTS